MCRLVSGVTAWGNCVPEGGSRVAKAVFQKLILGSPAAFQAFSKVQWSARRPGFGCDVKPKPEQKGMSQFFAGVL